jgi:PhnB protein
LNRKEGGIFMQIHPILAFGGHTEKALHFYADKLGAEVIVKMRWKDSPDPEMRAAAPDPEKIMHATFRIGATTLMATDGIASLSQPDFKGITLALEAKDDAEARQLFAALGDGGQVQMPLAKTFWTSLSGMVIDRFGLSWMVNVANPEQRGV